MRKIIRNRAIVDDHWQHLSDEDAIPESGDITVSWQRWQEEGEVLLARSGGRLGVRLNGDVPVEELPGGLEQVDIIALEFPVFKDGRCFSHARLLRTRHGYKGELRAIGNVLRDQMGYMERVGINAFEVDPDHSLEDALNAFGEISVNYQGIGSAPFPRDIRRAGSAAA